MSGLKNWFGIDFGTTNSSTVGILGTGSVNKTIRYGDDYGGPFPSLIAINKETGEVFCGRDAWEKRRELSDSCEVIPSIKSFLGTDRTWLIAGKQWSVELIAAHIFKSLKEQVKQKHGFTMDNAVVSIPVGFSPAKRKSLRMAAQAAGIKIENFISESTAAFFRNYEELKHYTKIAVFDWGGGTLDISIIENKDGKISEIATGGMQFGGDDIDLKLANWVHSKIMKDKGMKIPFKDMKARFQDMMVVMAERAKREMSDTDSTYIAISNYGEFGMVKVPIEIDVFSLLIEPHVNNAIQCLENAVRQANLSMEGIECVVMVGGSSNLRPLVERIESRWKGPRIFYPEDSVWCVAEGAAMIRKYPGQLRLYQEIGLILSDDSYFGLMNRNDVAPCKPLEVNFGIVEDSRSARFVFSDNTVRADTGSKKVLGRKNVSTYGFLTEQLKLKAFIDEDLVFRAEIKSDRKTQEYKGTWEYSDLKFYYEIPENWGV